MATHDKLRVNLKPTAPVAMQRSYVPPTSDQMLWVIIRKSANGLSFDNYMDFIEPIMCGDPDSGAAADVSTGAGRRRAAAADLLKSRSLPFPDIEPYRLLKVATEVFMMAHCGCFVDPKVMGRAAEPTLYDEDFSRQETDDQAIRLGRNVSPSSMQATWRDSFLRDVMVNGDTAWTLPYLREIIALKLGDVPIRNSGSWGRAKDCYGILRDKLTNPCLLELIWNYWHEEGMLVQSINAVAWRFQNRRGPADRDPLAMLEIDPLRPLSNLVWGWVQDEQHRLTLPRRAYEYDHEYGLRLLGKAVPQVRSVDSRSKFIEAFHNLLYLCSIFFKEDDDTTVMADGFPVLNALKEVHLLLTQGAHNAYGDLPWTARQEFLMMEWLLARPEMREFLPGRIMVDYPEPWMDHVESMKTLQGWTDTSILHFRDLAIHGEKLLLSVRYGLWTNVIEPDRAANWARYWRPEVQGYIHAYRTVTGADLTDRVDTTMPSLLLQQRLPGAHRLSGVAAQQLPAGVAGGQLPAGGRQQITAARQRQARQLPSGQRQITR
jgi:hypothetical protein